MPNFLRLMALLTHLSMIKLQNCQQYHLKKEQIIYGIQLVQYIELIVTLSQKKRSIERHYCNYIFIYINRCKKSSSIWKAKECLRSHFIKFYSSSRYKVQYIIIYDGTCLTIKHKDIGITLTYMPVIYTVAFCNEISNGRYFVISKKLSVV